MTVSAAAPVNERNVSPLLLKSENLEAFSEEKPKAGLQEMLLFPQWAQYAPITNVTPKTVAIHKPMFEQTGAAVASVHMPPTRFTTNSEGRFVVSTGLAHTGGVSTELASALSAPTENSRGQDKHEDGSPQYVSAEKTRADIRYERLDEPILGGIFSVC